MLESLFKKKKPSPRVEMEFPEVEVKKHHAVKVTKLESVDGIAEISASLARVDVLFVNIENFRNVEELKRVIARIKLAAAKYGGEVLGLDEGWLLITTKRAVLER